MAWATKEYATGITGVSVTDAQVDQAQAVIELMSGATEDYKLRPRDVRHLKMAVAYQAAWMKGQIDVATRTDVSQVTQDEMSFTYANDDAVVLAPLAQRALKRLSWKRSRSVQLKGPEDLRRQGDALHRFVTDANEETGYKPGWGP